VSKTAAATWPSACTPASVRPAPTTGTRRPTRRASAASTWPCTVGASGCSCHPAYAPPSYWSRRATGWGAMGAKPSCGSGAFQATQVLAGLDEKRPRALERGAVVAGPSGGRRGDLSNGG